MKRFQVHTVIFLFLGQVLLSQPAKAQGGEMKEFLMACTYGVMAGALIGASSLAFTEKPGENFNMVARGASLGLYAGIILGLYVVYWVPPLPANPNYGAPISQWNQRTYDPSWNVSFDFSKEGQWEGFNASYKVYRF